MSVCSHWGVFYLSFVSGDDSTRERVDVAGDGPTNKPLEAEPVTNG
ncbi:hypothetical protein [Natronorubrum tibetense]|nr:hypothetical protein [Natronorubrum tibetense]